VVCSGFVGNVVIKMLEGVSETIVRLGHYASKEKILWRAGLALLSGGISRLKEVTDWEQYGGAPVLGFDRLFIKAHGRSRARAITNAAKVAAKAVQAGLTDDIESALRSRAAAATSAPRGKWRRATKKTDARTSAIRWRRAARRCWPRSRPRCRRRRATSIAGISTRPISRPSSTPSRI
jgi:hypothetical protein